MQLDWLELPLGSRVTGIPHCTGTCEYLTCETGEVVLTVSEETLRLAPGDVVVFRGDQKHSYRIQAAGQPSPIASWCYGRCPSKRHRDREVFDMFYFGEGPRNLTRGDRQALGEMEPPVQAALPDSWIG